MDPNETAAATDVGREPLPIVTVLPEDQEDQAEGSSGEKTNNNGDDEDIVKKSEQVSCCHLKPEEPPPSPLLLLGDKSLPAIFTMVNYNYFVEDLSDQRECCLENGSGQIFLVYRLKNMMIVPEPIAIVRSNVNREPKSVTEQEQYLNQQTAINLVILPLTGTNRQLVSDFRRLTANNRSPTFRLASSSSRIVMESKFHRTGTVQIHTWTAEDRVDMFVKRFQCQNKQICFTHGDDGDSTTRTNSIEIISGTVRLTVNDDGDAFRLSGRECFRLTVQVNDTTVHLIGGGDGNDGQQQRPHSKPKRSAKETMIRITDLKRIITESNYKYDSSIHLSKEEERGNSMCKSLENSMAVTADRQQDQNQPAPKSPPSAVSESEFLKIRKQIIQRFSAKLEDSPKKVPPKEEQPKEELEKKDGSEKMDTEKIEEEKKEKMAESVTTPAAAIGKITGRARYMSNIDRLIKSQPGVIIVNKINLNQLNKTPAVISWNQPADGASLRSIVATPEIPPPSITKTKTIEAVKHSPSSRLSPAADRTINEKDRIVVNKTGNDRQEKSTPAATTAAVDQSYRTFRKMAIHDIQKSIQHLKYLNNFVMKNRDRFQEMPPANVDHNDDVRSKFDRYRKKLQDQLLRTIDSIERYVRYVHEEHPQQSQTKGEIPVATMMSATESMEENQDQIFFYNTIEKMMKLIMVLEPDVFRMISIEITDCLIAISNKFFVQNSQ